MKKNFKIINIIIALVWFVNGLFCKVLNFVPRHEQIVSRILSEEHSVMLTKLIGVLEILMAIWIISKIQSRFNAIIQMTIIGIMNVLEFIFVPDLLLFGKFNSVFAVLFIILIYYNEFILNKNVYEY